MAEPKNPFDFGTGSIDKDQWLRDIDAEQDNFVSRYSSAVNKHRATLLRDAFADLRRRIANGDMLNRTADGLYQFSSALNREDKHMQEAYQRALGFMGDLARRLIQAPPAEPEKKAIGSLEERYIKSLNPSGKFNVEAYWKNQTDKERRDNLRLFLNNELSQVKSYLDFGNFGDEKTYTDRLNNVIKLLDSENANDWTLQQLGFTKNWLQQPTDLEETETPKSELEQANERLQAATEAQQVQQINLLVAALTAPSPTYQALLTFNPSDYWNYDSFIRDRNKRIEALKYTDENGNKFLKANSILRRTPTGNGRFTNQVTTKNTAWNGLAAKDARTYALNQYAQEISSRLNNYFKNLGVNYQSILNNDRRSLMTNLALLFTQGPDNNYIMNDVINNLFARLLDGKFGLKGSTLSYDPSTHTLYNGNNIDTYKEGGILKGLNGLVVDDSYYVKPTNNTKKTEETPKLENSEKMDAGDWATIIGTTAADIGSMLSANAVGYGTIASAGLGLTSTLGNSVNEFRHGNVGSGLTNLGIGLTTDLIGLVPGFGAGAKGYKIGRTLTRFARPIMAAFAANNFKEAGEVLGKGVKNGFGNLTSLDWTVLGAALTSIVSRGKSAHTRLKNVEFMSKASQHSSPTDAKGNITKHIINEEGFIKAGKELLDLKRFGYNIASKNYTEGIWKSIPKGGEISTPFYAKPFEWPSLNFGKKNKQALMESFELQLNNRKKPDIPNKNYSAFEARMDAEASPLNIMGPKQPYPTGETYKKKRRTLTEEQKAARRQKIADKKKREQALKKLEELRRNQNFALAEEVPQAGTYADIRNRQLEAAILNSRFANEVELPIPAPRPAPGPRSEAFNLKYGKALGKKEYGGILKALRNGGIIKAKWGDDTSDWVTPLYNPESLKQEEQATYTNPYFPNIKYNGTAPWYKSRFSGESVVNLGNDDSGRANLPGGLTGNNLDYAFARNQAYVKSGLLNKLADILGYFDLLPSPVDANNLQGLTDIYNKAIDELYLPFTSGENVPDYLKTDATKHNLLFRLVYGSRAKVNGGDDNYDIGWNPDIIKIFGSASFARRPVNYETKWEDDLKNNLALAKDRVSKISHNGIEGYVYTDENGRIHPLTNDLLKLINGQQAPQKLNEEKGSSKVADSEGGEKTVFNTGYKNPNDPTPYIIAGKTALGLYGNRNIYLNLLDEMPQAPLRDPIDRKLAIVGWQEAIKQGQNQLADLRNATWMQHGSDLLTNLAGMYETEGKGRDIMNGQFMKDSGRLFETALKSWNLDNEDTLYNIGVGDANRKAIADRARMMAQIRAAWRSGDNNILMGALSDTGNWLLKKYQREQDIIDKAKELSLGTPEEQAQAALSNDTEYSRIMNKHAAGLALTDEEKAYVRRMQAEALRGIRDKFASSYYNTYHTPGFGGGYKETIAAKDGTKLEVAKLKARSKDNDRYVSMIKDLRTTRYRRRRR